MNILILSNTLGLGGTERVVQNIAFSLKEKNIGFVGVGTFDPHGPRSFFLEDKSIPVFDLNGKDLNEIINENHIDTVFVHMIGVDRLGIEDKNVTIVNEVIFCGQYSLNAHLNFVISNALATKIIERKGTPNINILYYPIDSKHWATASKGLNKENIKASLGLPKDAFIITRTARSELDKWGILFMRSMKQLLKRDKDIFLVTAGMPLLYIIFLRRYRSRIINFAPVGDDRLLSKIYTVGDIYFHTAEAGETFGMVLAEAMFFGLPVITHSTHFSKGGIVDYHIDNSQVELIENGENGLVSNNVDEINAYCELLKNDKKIAERISQYNRDKVIKNYDLEIITEKFLSMIKHRTSGSHSFDDISKIRETYYNCLGKIDKKYRYKPDESYVLKCIKTTYLIIRRIIRFFGYDIERIGFTYKSM